MHRFDLDYPVDCDDEYWEATETNKAFEQPHGKPSLVSSFISALKLNRILGVAMRTLVRRFIGTD
jgi:hypothetical protein